MDLSFDTSANKSSGGAFNFGAWGKGWNTGSTWGFNALGTDTQNKENKTNPWSLGSEKNKKGVGFGALSMSNGDDNNNADDNGDDDGWAGFTTVKDKKKKKGGIEEAPVEQKQEPAQDTESNAWSVWGSKMDTKKDKPEEKTAASVAATDDMWAPWTTKKNKKGRNIDLLADSEPTTAPANPVPETVAGNIWSTSTSKNDKPKTNNVWAAFESKDNDEDDGWGWGTVGKKNKKKSVVAEDPVQVAEPAAAAEATNSAGDAKDSQPEAEKPAAEENHPFWNGWETWTAAEKRKKEKEAKKKGIPPRKELPPKNEPEPEPEPKAEEVKAEAEPEQPPEAKAEPEEEKNDPFWDGWETWSPAMRKKKEKEAVKKGIPPRKELPPKKETEPEPQAQPEEANAEPEPEQPPESKAEPEEEKNHPFWDGWENWSPAMRKKKEKEAVKKGIPPRKELPPRNEPEPEPEPEPELKAEEVKVEPEPEQPPAAKAEPEEEKNDPFWDDWDKWTPAERKKKEKEAKKKGIPPRKELPPKEKPEPEPEPEQKPEPEPEEVKAEAEPEQAPEAKAEPEEEKNHPFWDGWENWSPTMRKKKEKEAAKKGIPPRKEPTAKKEPEPEAQPEAQVEAPAEIDAKQEGEAEPQPEAKAEPEPAPENHPFWADWDKWTPTQRKKKEKEAVKKGIPPRKEPTVAEPDSKPESEPAATDMPTENKDLEVKPETNADPVPESAPEQPAEDKSQNDFWAGWDSWTAAERKKKEKEAKKKGIPPRQELAPAPEPRILEATAVEEDPHADFWAGWETWSPSERRKKEKEAKKKGIPPRSETAAAESLAEEPPPPAPTPPPQGVTPDLIMEERGEDDPWAGFATKTSKSLKKGTLKSPKAETKLQDMPKESAAAAARGFWSTFGSPSTSKAKPKDEKPKEKNDVLIDLGVDAQAPAASRLDGSAATAAPPPAATSKTTSTPGRLSVAERIAILEKKKKEKQQQEALLKEARTGTALPSSDADAAAPPPAPELAPEPASEDVGKKTASTTKSKSKLSKSIPAAPEIPAEEPVADATEELHQSIPGSFPEPVHVDEAAESSKDKQEPSQEEKETKEEERGELENKEEPAAEPLETEPAPETTEDNPPAPPPPESTTTGTTKKERKRIERTAGGSSWGFWGVAPPPRKATKVSKAKDDSETPATKEEKPALSRSKSDATKRPKVRESENDADKSSSEHRKRSEAKRSSKQTMGLSNFILGGPPPAKSKPVRRSNTVTSRPSSKRYSTDVDDHGTQSAPEDKPEAPDKAAKVMGVKPSKSHRERSHSRKRHRSKLLSHCD